MFLGSQRFPSSNLKGNFLIILDPAGLWKLRKRILDQEHPLNWEQPQRKVQNEKQGGRWGLVRGTIRLGEVGEGGTPGGEAGGLGSMFTFNLISSRGLAMKFSKMGGIGTKGHASIREGGGGRGGGVFSLS